MLVILYALYLFGALVAVMFVGPGWVFVWELRKGRTIPPFRVERAKQPRLYWLCIVTHAVLLVLWVPVCVFLFLMFVVMQPGFDN
jgi:hypothetical protein